MDPVDLQDRLILSDLVGLQDQLLPLLQYLLVDPVDLQDQLNLSGLDLLEDLGDLLHRLHQQDRLIQ